MKTGMMTGTWWKPLAITALWAQSVSAQLKEDVIRGIDALSDEYASIAQRIWDYAEVGYLETRSSELLQSTLRDAGFALQAGVASMPTAFVASYGSGKPILGILAEFDALPGISQDRSPERRVLPEKNAGHACGHHLFGTGSVAAAIAAKEWLERSRASGTIRLYGSPAEEGGAGKVYMVRAGLFSDVDAVLHWHAGDRNSAAARSSLANKSAKFRFYGLSAHASGAPERGRSALDGVEAMNDMVNMLREHVPQESRIHYVITSGGAAPNVVPDFAEVYYYVRHPDPKNVITIFDRVVKAAEGAALGTETRMEYEVIHGTYALLANETLSRAMHANLKRVGGVEYTDDERKFAQKIRESFTGKVPALSSAAEIEEFHVSEEGEGGSTDVGDVSWVVPTAGMRAATYVPGTPGHSWQAIASGGTSIGNKGMIIAAKTLTLTAIDLFEDPGIASEARREWERRVGPNFAYESLVGDRPPPLDYRKPARR
jgi:aminobenzoyl-glutamate utilization protein B